MLSKIERGFLVIIEGEHASMNFAKETLSEWFEIKISHSSIKQAAQRLVNLKLAKWHYSVNQRRYVSSRLPKSLGVTRTVTIRATSLGESFLEETREKT